MTYTTVIYVKLMIKDLYDIINGKYICRMNNNN